MPSAEADTSVQILGLEHLTHLSYLQAIGDTAALKPTERPQRRQGLQRSDRLWTGPAALGRRVRCHWAGLPLLGRVPLPLAVVLLVQAGLSLRLVWSNTAFADEALYLWAGHLEWQHWLNGTPVTGPGLPTYFSGAPVVYPAVGALADSLGGLATARLLSLAFMLAATGLLYATTARLYGRRSAFFAAGLFAGLAATQFLGAFATYDAMSLFLLALAAWLVVRAAELRPVASGLLLALAGVTLAAANAAKYASALYDPVVIAVAVLAAIRGTRQAPGTGRAPGKGKALRGLTALVPLAVAAALIAAGLTAGGHQYVTGIEITTLARAAGTASVSGVLFVAGKWTVAVLLLAVCGAVGAGWSRGRADGLLGWCLATAVFLAPVGQARIHTMTSLFKHVGYGAWFGSIVAGYALASLVNVAPKAKERQATRVGLAAVAAAAVAGIALAGQHFASWPASTGIISQIKPALQRAGCPCLFTQNNVVQYYLRDQVRHDVVRNDFSFYYWDRSTRRELHGTSAYLAAIEARYFRVVETDPRLNPTVYQPVVAALDRTHAYRLAGISPSGITGEPAEVWELGG